MTRSVEIPEEALTAAVTAYRSEGLRERVASTPHMRAALEAALPYLAPAEPKDTRTEEEKGFVEIALNAVDAGNAGSWPTVAGYLADEVRRLRAAPAGDGGLREALVKVLESPVELWHAKGFRVPAVPGTVLCALLDAHPAVPQPVDREALAKAWDEGHSIGWKHHQDGNYGNDYWDDTTPNPYRLAGEQEQVESPE